MTVKMPSQLLEQLWGKAGPRELSGHVQRAVARQLQRDALAAAVASYEAETEPFTPAELERARTRLRAARGQE